MPSSGELMKHRWGFLSPWCAALDGQIAHVSLDDPDGAWKTVTWGLEVKLPKRDLLDHNEAQFQTKFQKAREALALLSAVAHVDYDAWKYLLTKYCGLQAAGEGEEAAEVHLAARFLLIMDLRGQECATDPTTATYDLVQFCGVHQRLHPTRAYLRALSKIASLDKRLKLGKPGVDIQIPARVLFSVDDTMPSGEHMRNLKNIGRAQKMIQDEWKLYEGSTEKHKVESGSLRCTFVLEPIDAEFGDYGITSDMVETITGVARDKVHFSQLLLRLAPDLEAETWKSKKAFGQMMTHLFGDGTDRSDSSVNERKSLRLVCDITLPIRSAEAMFSAIVQTQNVNDLWLRLELDSADGSWWMWLAYALFSRRARSNSSVDTLTLTGIDNMSDADMLAFAAVLASDHPEEDLCGVARGQVDEKDAMLKAGAQIHWQFDTDGQPRSEPQALPSSTSIRVRTFGDDGDSEWVNAMAPGFGRCQVRRADLEFEPHCSASSRQVAITSLTLGLDDFEHADFGGLIRFLEAVGTSLKSLTLDITMVDIDVQVILLTCPVLEELTLCGGKVDIQFNFRELRATRQNYPVIWNRQWDDVAVFARRLTGANSELSKCVSRLRFRLLNHWEGETDLPEGVGPQAYEADLRALLEMLENNETLEYLDVIISHTNFGHLSKFRAHHLTPLPRVLEPLSTASKVAFLSVVASALVTQDSGKKRGARKTQPNPAAALFKLDHHVISTIFAFAAPPVLRKVYFRLQCGSWGWRNDWVSS